MSAGVKRRGEVGVGRDESQVVRSVPCMQGWNSIRIRRQLTASLADMTAAGRGAPASVPRGGVQFLRAGKCLFPFHSIFLPFETQN